jgi:hypothetical protein
MQGMDLQEFMRLGFLQEANRVFFHPVGLALTVVTDTDTGTSTLVVDDERGDPEGFVFPPEMLDTEAARAKAAHVQELWESKVEARIALLGAPIQDVPGL